MSLRKWQPRPAKQWEGPMPTPRSPALRVADTRAKLVVPVPKEAPIQHAGYMQLVRQMRCAHCQRLAPSQFCHSDEGKGAGLKTDCRRGWPGCADSVGRVGCHSLIGSTGLFTREHRRMLEAKYAAETRAAIIKAGLWPKDLPRWKE